MTNDGRNLYVVSDLSRDSSQGSMTKALLAREEPRVKVDTLRPKANLIGSKLDDGTHMPILDLDFDHKYVPSSTPGHGHLYLNVPVSKARWIALMIGLYAGGVIQKGYFWWSLRRGANFVRPVGVYKDNLEF